MCVMLPCHLCRAGGAVEKQLQRVESYKHGGVDVDDFMDGPKVVCNLIALALLGCVHVAIEPDS